jgi:phytoene/squalene synthetase
MSGSANKVPPPDLHWTRESLPRPFEDAPRDVDARSLVSNAWEWHEALSALAGESIEMRGISDSLRAGAIESEREDPRINQDAQRAYQRVTSAYPSLAEELINQADGAEMLSGCVRVNDASELDRLVRKWTGAHARVLGGIAGIGRYSWQERLLDEASRGFFLTAALMTLREDLIADRVLFPLSDAEAVSMNLDDLTSGRVTEPVRRFLWKQVVRARDSFAQSQRLVDDLERREAAAFRRWWFASLEILNRIEKNRFDVWQHPPRLSAYHRAHVRFQARFGRTTFR